MTDYVDFEEENVAWCWVERDGAMVYEKVKLNHMIFGDTDSGGFSLEQFFPPDADVGEVVGFADDLGRIVNESFPDFCMRAFNCPESRRTTIKTDREVVSDKSLFLSKKRYVMSLVDQEGKRVNKLKIMGVEIKKSDTSKAIKKMLMDLVNYILDGLTMEQVLDKIREMRKDFDALPVSEIAKPINVKTLKKCQDSLAMTGEMTGFPYQVRATMFWNQMCGPRDRKIMPGEKVGLVYIRNPKSKYIAFPIDMEFFPEWFDELYIDRDTEWEKAHKKLQSYLSSIGWDIQGRKDAIKSDLFGI